MAKYKKIIIGIDQSYKRTGISIIADGEVKKISYVDLKSLKNNSEKRAKIKEKLNKIFAAVISKSESIIVIIERIRLRSNGFLNINYIKSIGALNATIVDVCYNHNVKCYSVDTRAWKAAVVGTTKSQSNNYFVDPKKWLTIKYVINLGFEKSILIKLPKNSKIKNYFVRNNNHCLYNDDAADSCCIGLFGFVGNVDKLQEEK